ncbi:MAG: LpqB family beta-propeller domain-containing protein, partial [Actinomycetes bacterium]
SWVDSTTLAIIGTSSGQAAGPLLIDIDRTVTPFSTDALAHFTSIVGAPSLPLMAATSQSQIWESSGAGWTKLVKGSDPAYPG